MHKEIENTARQKAAELLSFALKTIKLFQKKASIIEDRLALTLLHNIHSLKTDYDMTPKNTADCIMTMLSKYHFDTKDILKF